MSCKEIKKSFSLKEFMRFVIPSIVSMILYSAYTIVDGIFVSHGVGETALAAVEISMPYLNGIFALTILFSIGTATLCAMYIGRGKEKDANILFTQNTVVLSVIAIIITGLVHLFTEELAAFLGATDATMEYVVTYIRTVSCFTICLMVSYSLEVLAKTGGHPSLSVIGISACCITNIALDYIFVMKLHMGVYGAALATGIAQTASLIVYFIHFALKRSKLKFIKTKPYLYMYGKIIRLGSSAFFCELSLAYIVFMFNHTIIQTIGESGLVSYALITYVNILVLAAMDGISQGMQPLVAMNLGRCNFDACRGYKRYAFITTFVAAAIFVTLCEVFAPTITSILIQPTSVNFAPTVNALKLYSIGFIFAGFNIVSAGYFTAIERPRSALCVAMMRGFVMITISLLVMPHFFGATGLWLSAAASEAASCVVMGILMLYLSKHPVTIAQVERQLGA